MSFPRYPRYKDSGVEWLGQVPEHWEKKPLYASATERNEPNKGMINDNLLSLSYGRIVRKDISLNDGLLPESFETYQVVRPGDIVFRPTDLQNDWRSLRSAIVEETGIITSAYIAVTPCGPDSRYLSHLFRSYDAMKVFYSMGGGLRQSMKYSDLKRLPIILPPVAEQTAIAAFLDRETGKIDELVAEQRRLMELLKEKRQAVISHAVTRGLNPAAPLQPSGIEWLGDVPKHWAHTAVRHLVEEHKQGFYTKDEYIDDGTPLLRITDIKDDSTIDFTNCPKLGLTDAERQQFELKVADFVFVRSGASIGKFGIVEEASGAVFGSYTIRFRFRSQLHRNFLKWSFQSRGFLDGLFSSLHGGAIVNVNAANIKDQVLAIPPELEQEAIASYLERETRRIDTLTAEAQRAIDLLQERRTALISAAVTGQIDVHNAPRN